MKLTRINVKGGDVAKVEIEMSAHEFYRISDALRADAEKGGDFSRLAKKMALAAEAQGVEKQILDTFEAARKAVDQGVIQSAEGEFCAVEA